MSKADNSVVVDEAPDDDVEIGESPDGDRLSASQARHLLWKRRDVLVALGALGSVAAIAEAGLEDDNGNLYGGTMALEKAYRIGPRTYMGPDSAKSAVLDEIPDDEDEGYRYEAVDTQVKYWLDDGAWQGPEGIGSQQESVPEAYIESGNIDDAQVGRAEMESARTPTNLLATQAGRNAVVDDQAPHAVYVASENTTFAAYRGYDADPFVFAFDHDTATVSGHVRAARSPLSDTDEHGCPTMAVDDDGYIHLFFGGHNSGIQYVKSANPYDISQWGGAADLALDKGLPSGAYPSPAVHNNNLYVLYRSGSGHGSSYPAHEYATLARSTDGGSTWSDLGPIIDLTGHPDAAADAYVRCLDEHNGNLHLSWHIAHGGSHDENRDYAYHAYYNPSDGGLYDLAGSSYGSTITWSNHGGALEVTGNPDSMGPHQAFDGETVYLLFNQYDSGSGNQEWKLATWNGSWSIQQVGDAVAQNAINPGDIRITDDGDVECHVVTDLDGTLRKQPVAPRDGNYDVWTLSDGSWSSERIYEQSQSGPIDGIVKPTGIGSVACPRDAPDEFASLFADALLAADGWTGRLWGRGMIDIDTSSVNTPKIPNIIQHPSKITTGPGENVEFLRFREADNKTRLLYEDGNSAMNFQGDGAVANSWRFTFPGQLVAEFHSDGSTDFGGGVTAGSGAGFQTGDGSEDLRGKTGNGVGEIRVHDGSGTNAGQAPGPKAWKADGTTDAWFDGNGNSFT